MNRKSLLFLQIHKSMTDGEIILFMIALEMAHN